MERLSKHEGFRAQPDRRVAKAPGYLG